jgi:hypothetical protein
MGLVDRGAALDREARTVFLNNGGDVLLGVHTKEAALVESEGV